MLLSVRLQLSVAIQLMLLDVRCHGGWNLITQAAAFSDRSANLGAANLALRHVDQVTAELVGLFGRQERLEQRHIRSCVSTAGNDDDEGEAANFLWLAPLGEIDQCIGTHQEYNLSVRQFGTNFPQRVDRERGSTALELAIVRLKKRVATDSDLQHFPAVFAVGRTLLELEWRGGSQNKTDFRKSQLFATLFGSQ